MGGGLTIDAIGYAAAGLVLATFYMRSMSRLRWVAIASNAAFIAYGYLAHLAPVLALHVMLLPLNVRRLTELHGSGGQGPLASMLKSTRGRGAQPSEPAAADATHEAGMSRQEGLPDEGRTA